MGHGFFSKEDSNSSREHRQSSSRDIGEVCGSDWSQVPEVLREIFQAACAHRYNARVITPDGVVGIYLADQLLLRVALGKDRLSAGKWEVAVTKLFVQERLLQEISKSTEASLSSEQMETALKEVLLLPEAAELNCALHHFPGAVQCLISLRGQLLGSMVFNPIHKFVLEFRLDARPLELERSTAVPTVMPRLDAAPALLSLAARPELRALIVIDGPESFGSELRRTFLRVLPYLSDAGFTSLVLDIEESEEHALQGALSDGNPLPFLLRHGDVSPADISPEWTALMTLAHALGLRLCGGARQAEKSSLFEQLQEGSQNERALVWLPFSEMRRAVRWLERMHACSGIESVALIASMSSQKVFARLSAEHSEEALLLPLRRLLSELQLPAELRALLDSEQSDAAYCFLANGPSNPAKTVN